MAVQVYFCESHEHNFEISVPFSVKHPLKRVICPLNEVLGFGSLVYGSHYGVWRPSAAYFIVKDGTGAAKRSRINA